MTTALIRTCRCGNKITHTTERSYVNRHGELKVYQYPAYECRPCKAKKNMARKRRNGKNQESFNNMY